MKIVSWNVAGIRACLKRGSLDFLTDSDWDIVCFQETKAEESQVIISKEITSKYKYRFWNSTKGTTQRKGLSGTSIWSTKKPVREIQSPSFDEEGRITTIEFHNWILVTVYTPNSQTFESERHAYRVFEWDIQFREYIESLNKYKPTIICGDFNTGHKDIDVEKPREYRNRCAGFFDDERENFNTLLNCGWFDSFRHFHPDKKECYTYWNQRIPLKRKLNRGWRIDYFLVPDILSKRIKSASIFPDIIGSDHCPISIEFVPIRKLSIIE